MLSFVANRVLTAIPVIVLITVAVFSVMQLLPGDPTLAILGDEATPQSRAALRERMGLNRPVHVQYLSWLGGLAKGDLGRSLVDNTPVVRAVSFAFPVTLQIALVSLFISLSVGVPLGILSAVRRGGVVDALSSVFALSAISIPAFWAGILLMYFVALQLG
ncbi:MAG TPA: ABC transporter permease [Trueperaceae bacterium]